MSNNIIDTVTQAVNSLVSALKLPDESAKANDTLGSMNFPQFSRILPYKDYDSATGLFINNKTIGFMFEARPLPGADNSIVATLEHLLRSKLPRGVPVSFHLGSSKLVGNDIDYGLREFRWSGKQAKKLNAITIMTIATPVVIIIPGCVNITFRASLSIIPHSAVGALTPNPRKENPDICNIIEHIELLAIIAM